MMATAAAETPAVTLSMQMFEERHTTDRQKTFAKVQRGKKTTTQAFPGEYLKVGYFQNLGDNRS